MLKIKILKDPEKVAQRLKTNRELKVGQIIASGDDYKMRLMAAMCGDMVELQGDEKAMTKPKKNKMLKKSKKFKAKG